MKEMCELFIDYRIQISLTKLVFSGIQSKSKLLHILKILVVSITCMHVNNAENGHQKGYTHLAVLNKTERQYA